MTNWIFDLILRLTVHELTSGMPTTKRLLHRAATRIIPACHREDMAEAWAAELNAGATLGEVFSNLRGGIVLRCQHIWSHGLHEPGWFVWLTGWHPQRADRMVAVLLAAAADALQHPAGTATPLVSTESTRVLLTNEFTSAVDFTLTDTFDIHDPTGMAAARELRKTTEIGSMATLGPLYLMLAMLIVLAAGLGDATYMVIVAFSIPAVVFALWRNRRLETHFYYRTLQAKQRIRSIVEADDPDTP